MTVANNIAVLPSRLIRAGIPALETFESFMTPPSSYERALIIAGALHRLSKSPKMECK
jgi:hypothetical protein